MYDFWSLLLIFDLFLIGFFILVVRYPPKQMRTTRLAKILGNWNLKISRKPREIAIIVAIPVIITLAYIMAGSLIGGVSTGKKDFLTIVIELIQPFFEEVIFRGAVLGAFFALAAKLSTGKRDIHSGLAVIVQLFGLVIQASLFSFAHGVELGSMLYKSRLATGLIFGLFFWRYKGNLVACTASHITVNGYLIIWSLFN